MKVIPRRQAARASRVNPGEDHPAASECSFHDCGGSVWILTDNRTPAGKLQEALALVDAIPPLQRGRGRPRQRPNCVLGDRGYDATAIRRGLRARHIVPWLAMRRTAHESGLGRWRWVVERTFAWLNQFRRLRVRYDKRADIHEAFLSLGCAWICWQSLRKADDGLGVKPNRVSFGGPAR
jgi:transposase